MKLSIVVPVYNSEKYIEECLNSILNIKYNNFEVLVVDNGSSDKSVSIIENIIKIDNRVKLLKEDKKGVSNARNKGIECSDGDYLMFVDSDDTINSDCVEYIVSNISKYDMICFGYNELYMNKESKRKRNTQNTDNLEFIKYIFEDDSIGGFVWNKVYNLKIIKKNNIIFSNKTSMCEDLLFNIMYLKNVSNIQIVNQCLVNYRMRINSISKKSNKINSIMESYTKIITNLKNDYNLDCKFIDYYFLCLLYKESEIVKIKNNLREKYIELLKDNSISRKRKIKLIILNKFTFIYKIYMYIKCRKNVLFE